MSDMEGPKIRVEQTGYGPMWQRSGQFWRSATGDDRGIEESLRLLDDLNVVLDDPGPIGGRPAVPNILANLAGEKTDAERFESPWYKGSPRYGSMPHFNERLGIVSHFSEEAEKLGKTQSGNPRTDKPYAEGILLFELKFGKKLSGFAQEILDHYPPREGGTGKLISIFGLSGCGKSTVAEVLQEQFSNKLVVIDSDTVRYNLFAKLIKDAEAEAGSSVENIQNKGLMHNAISGSMYVLIDYVSKELKQRGYAVVRLSSYLEQDADIKIYVEHPDGIDPENIGDDTRDAVADVLYGQTQSRVDGKDDYNWDHAATVTDFREMKPVTVQVPKGVHIAFLRNTKRSLENGKDIVKLSNPRIDDPQGRKESLRKGLVSIWDIK